MPEIRAVNEAEPIPQLTPPSLYRGPAICPNNFRLPQAVLDEAVLDAMIQALDAELVEAAVAQAFARLTETAAETADRRPMLEGEITEARRREQRLAEAILHGAPGDAAPEALLSTLCVEETRRKNLEEQLAALPQSIAVVSIDRYDVSRELRARADDVRGVLHRQGLQARGDASESSCGSGDCTFGGLLPASTWPPTFGGPIGIRTQD